MKKLLSNLWTFLRRSMRWGAYLLTSLTSTVYLLGALSPHIRPSLSAIPAFLGLVFPLLFLAQLAMFLYWIVRGRWRIVGLLCLVWAISWGAISAYFPINREHETEQSEEAGRTIKVLSYNTQGFGFRQHSASRPNPILQYIKSVDADIVCLQESITGVAPKYGVTREQLNAYLGTLYPYIKEEYAQPHGSLLFLLSKFPIKASERIPIESYANGAVWYQLEIEGEAINVINLHLESFRLRKQDGKKYVQMVGEGNALGIKGVVTNKFGPVFVQHEQQAEQIAEVIARDDVSRTIVCGDFNDTPISYARKRIAQDLQDTYIERGNGLGLSYTTGLYRVRIDHILCGSAFEPLTSVVDASIRASDHYPIIATLRLRTPQPQQ